MKKRLALLTLASIMLTSSVPVYASGDTSTTMNATSSFTSELAPTDLSQIVVSIPDNMDLALNNDKTKFVSSGNVSAKGTLKDGYQLSVSTNESATYKCTGKPDVAGTVTFGTQTWSSAQLEASKTTLDSRAVSVEVANSDDLAAGTYTTNILFNIGVSEAHVHTAGSPVKEREVAPTVEANGSYDEVVYCSVCGEEVSRTAKSIVPQSFTLDSSNYNMLGLGDYSSLQTATDNPVDLDIPAIFKYDGVYYKTVRLDNAFKNCKNIKSVIVPSSVTSIDNQAFRGCENLASITIPDSVTSIGDSVFRDCKSLTSITIPDSVTSIGGSAFWNCTSLASITIPDSVTSIGKSTFCNCTNLASITIPDSVTSIGVGVFNSCTNLASIEIPNSVTSIGAYAFYNCDSLTSIEIPNSVTSIGNYAFGFCDNLASIEIPSSVTSISDDTFSNCKSLTSITIPDSVTSIGAGVFSNCDSLTSITIPDSVTSIGDSAFSNCTRLTSIIIPSSVTSIGDYAFNNCTSLGTISYSGTKNRFKELFPADCFHYDYYDDSHNEITGYLDNITIKCSDGEMTFSGGAYSE